MAKKRVPCPECNGRGETRHRDSVREIFYGDKRPIYRKCYRCEGQGWINKPGWLENSLWDLFSPFRQ
jgi:DnaJ-class molecular chaperone